MLRGDELQVFDRQPRDQIDVAQRLVQFHTMLQVLRVDHRAGGSKIPYVAGPSQFFGLVGAEKSADDQYPGVDGVHV